MARSGERKTQILQTLARMLEGPAAERITTAALAKQIEVSEAALYRHFKGKDYLDRPWIAHYRADGRGVLITHDGSRIPRTWAVEGKEQVCVESQFPRVCFRLQRDKAQAGMYRIINVANDMTTVFVAEDGVPQF